MPDAFLDEKRLKLNYYCVLVGVGGCLVFHQQQPYVGNDRTALGVVWGGRVLREAEGLLG